MITVKITVADLYHRLTSVEDIQRQLRLDNPHCSEKEIEIRLRGYSLAADMCKVSRAQTRAGVVRVADEEAAGLLCKLAEAAVGILAHQVFVAL